MNRVLVVAAVTLLAGNSASANDAAVTCPAPQACEVLQKAMDHCEAKDRRSCWRFVSTFKALLPKYDCKRSFDKEPVPAVWLCQNHERFLNFLSGLKTPSARRLYGSPQLRRTLSGHMAEEHYSRSGAVGRKLKKKKESGNR